MMLNVWALDDAEGWPSGERNTRMDVACATGSSGAGDGPVGGDYLPIHHRRRTECVPVADVVYLKAELKYVTVRTAQRIYLYDGSLCELERRHPELWLRTHRNTLVARHRLQALERCPVGEGVGAGWCVRLQGVPEWLPVSRRQLAVVRAAWAAHQQHRAVALAC